MSRGWRRAPGGASFLDKLREAGRDDFYMFAQMRPETDVAWADAAVTIPGCYYWTSGEAPADQRWNPFDAVGLLRPALREVESIDGAYLREAVAAFQRSGFHGPLNYYRAIDPFFAIASGPYAGATIGQPSWFLTGTDDGLRSFRPDEATMRQALPGLRGITTLG